MSNINMNNKIQLSVVMIVKNEEKVLTRCLESVKELANELIIVDTGSNDKTIEIAEKYGAKVYFYKWQQDFSAARNFAIDKATGEWCLSLDADEWIEEAEREELEKFFIKKRIGVVEIINLFNEDGEMAYNRTYTSRIFPKEARYKGKIHEQIVGYEHIRMPVVIGHDGYLDQDKSERNLGILFEVCNKEVNDDYAHFQLAHTLRVAGRTGEALKYFKEFYERCPREYSYRGSAIVDYLNCSIQEKEFAIGLELIEKEKEYYIEYPDFHFACARFYHELVLSDVKKYIQHLPKIEEEYIRCLEIGETTKYDTIQGCGSYAAAYNLGVWYEVTKQIDKAKTCYRMASEWGYNKAKERLIQICNE